VSKPLFLLAEAFGENEARIGAPLVGASGIELLNMLAESGNIVLTSADHDYMRKFWDRGDPALLDMVWRLHPEVHRSNVFQQRPPGNKLEWFCGPRAAGIPGYPPLIGAKCVRAEFQHELERLGDELVSVDPSLVLCLGNAALWALSGKTGVSKLRGTTSVSTHTATGYKLLPTYHPAAVLRQYELRPIVIMDLTKAAREKEFPEVRRPRRAMWVEPGLSDLDLFYEQYIVDCKMLSVDIETLGNQITEVGFAPTPYVSIVIPFVDFRKRNKSYWATYEEERLAWYFVKKVCESPIPKVGQNITYDVAFMYRTMGIKIMNVQHDTMLAHHALQPESLKGLGFLGSCYCNIGAWKAEHREQTAKRDA